MVPEELSPPWPGPSWGGASASQLVGRGLDFLVPGLVNSQPKAGEEEKEERGAELSSQPPSLPAIPAQPRARLCPQEGQPLGPARGMRAGGLLCLWAEERGENGTGDWLQPPETQ